MITKRNSSKHWNQKLTEEDISTIFEIHKQFLKARRALYLHSAAAASEILGKKSCDLYYGVVKGKPLPRIPQETKQFILDNEAKRIQLRKVFRALSPEAMAPKLGIHPSHWRNIVNGKSWKTVGDKK